MGYITDDSFVRVDIFKPSGKWYTTLSLRWDRYYPKAEECGFESLNNTLRRCMKEQIEGRFQGMWAVCIEPHSDISYPLMIMV